MKRVRAPPVPTVNDGRPLTEHQAGRAAEIAAIEVESWSYRLIMNAVDETGETLLQAVRRDRANAISKGVNQ